MAKKRPEPVLTHTELLCLAYRALEADIARWRETCADLPDASERVANICARQIKQLEAIRQMYLIETGTEM